VFAQGQGAVYNELANFAKKRKEFDRVFDYLSRGEVETNGVTLDGLHITAGQADDSESIGGGLFFEPSTGAAELTIRNTNFYGNAAKNGGAIGVFANGMEVATYPINVTFAGNHASLQGGAIAASQNNGGTTLLDLLHVSFGGNTAGIGNSGSALYLDGAAANVRNSIRRPRFNCRRNGKEHALQGIHTQHYHHAPLLLPKQCRSRSPKNQGHSYKRLGLRLKRLLAIFLRMDVPANGKTRHSLSK